MSTQVKIEKMLQKTAVVLAAGGEKRIAKQHAAGKMTARERIASLLDENSFVESVSYTHLTLPTTSRV